LLYRNQLGNPAKNKGESETGKYFKCSGAVKKVLFD
jgi:hypothetical protein